MTATIYIILASIYCAGVVSFLRTAYPRMRSSSVWKNTMAILFALVWPVGFAVFLLRKGDAT